MKIEGFIELGLTYAAGKLMLWQQERQKEYEKILKKLKIEHIKVKYGVLK